MKNFNSIKYFLILLSLGLSIDSSIGQESSFEHFKQVQARNIGPAGMSGRVTAIDVNLSNPSMIYVGTASGGVWLSDNGGVDWRPIFDDQHVLSIGALKINQSNPSEIWVGTGEGNPRNSQNSGAGVFRSIDGGKTWEFKGLKDTRVIHRILIDESKDGVVYVGAQGAAWGPSEHRGLYKTIDDGNSWDKILYANDQTGIADLVMDPSNPNKIIAAMWEYGRTPAFFNSGGPGSGLHITHDGGTTWDRVEAEDGFPKGDLGRIGVAIAPSEPSTVYAIVEAKENALYKSNNGGANWHKVGAHENMGNRPFYYSEIYVDPQNENRLYSLWTYLSKSEDGGRTFEIIADYDNSVHPDHHALWISPTDPDYIINGNDGGMNFTYDQGENWRFMTNLPVGQFYHVNVDDDFPYNVYGGMQDNGSWVGPAFTLKRGGITNHDWQEVYFGDGFDVAPKPGDTRYVYAMSQGGNVGLVDKETGQTQFVKPNHPDSVTLRFNWNAPLALEPNTDCGLYYGSQFVHYSNDCGQSWSIISPDLTTNDTTKQKQHISGGLTIDATNAENNTCLIAIAPSAVDDDVIWAGSDDGRLHISRNGGSSWTDVYSRLPGAPVAGWIPQIQTGHGDAGEAWVVVNNYRQNDWEPYLYHTKDYGNTWSRRVRSGDVHSFVTSVLQDPQQSNLVYLGTDAGLYISIDGGNKWHHFDEGLPSVQIRDMAYQETFDDLVLGTFGRAFWVIDDLGVFRSMAQDDYMTDPFKIVSTSPAYLGQFRSYQGIRFYGQGEFIADNKSTNPVMSIWVKPKDESEMKKKKAEQPESSDQNGKKGKKDKKDKIKFTVLNSSADTIRQFSRMVDKEGGLQRISWNLRQDGVAFPSRRERPADSDAPGGVQVLPGDYKVVAQYGDQADSTMITVSRDPRLNMTARQEQQVQQAMKDYEAVVEMATEEFSKITEAKKTLKVLDAMISTIQDTTQNEWTELSKEHHKSLNDLELLFMDAQGLKGIQRNPNNLNAFLGTARRYISSSTGTPGANAQIALNKAKTQATEVSAKIAEYMSSDWVELKEKVKSFDFDIFKD